MRNAGAMLKGYLYYLLSFPRRRESIFVDVDSRLRGNDGENSHGRPWMFSFLLLLVAATLLPGCVVNPVTGETELGLISRSQEISIGENNYLSARQMQGGDYEVNPELVNYVQSVGQKLVAVSDRPELPYEFTVINNPVPNAWALPGGKIAVNRGLLTKLDSEAELAAVLAHEIVHAAARHTAQSISRGRFLQLGALALAVSGSDSEYANLIAGGAMVGAALINKKYTREAESEADYYGIKYMAKAGYNPQAAVELQKTFLQIAKEKGRSSGWLAGLFASHPPSAERVAANRQTAQAVGTTGFVGEDIYRKKTAELRAAIPAYETYQEGLKALAEGNAANAAELANKAISIEPAEAKFYGLLGDSWLLRDNYQRALAKYETALAKNPGYYAFYLGQGQAQLALNNYAAARESFKQSNQLLPTAIAHQALGSIALRANNVSLAVEHFQVAAQSDSPAGRRARAQLEQLQRQLRR